jgi:hypothetical protein
VRNTISLLRRWGAPALVVIAAVVANAAYVGIPVGGDDAYVIPNLLSSDPLRFLFAFHYDAPSDDFTPWYTGVVYQRRFLRLPACALLVVEARLFGRDGLGYHMVTLLLVIATLLVVYRLFHDWLGDRTAACVALLPVACHPAVGEIVSKVSCQPIAFAGLFCALAVQAWVGWRRTERRAALAAALAAAFIAMTSYEGAVVLPLLVVLGDLWFARAADWRSRIAMLVLIAAYVPAATAARFDLVHPETEPMRPLAVVLESIRIDGGNYLLKLFGLFDTNESIRYALYNYVGELPALAIALSFVALLGIAARRQSWALLGAATFLVLLAPALADTRRGRAPERADAAPIVPAPHARHFGRYSCNCYDAVGQTCAPRAARCVRGMAMRAGRDGLAHPVSSEPRCNRPEDTLVVGRSRRETNADRNRQRLVRV